MQTMVAAGVEPDQRAFSLMAYAWSKSWRWESNSGPSIFTRTSSLPKDSDSDDISRSRSTLAASAQVMEGSLSGSGMVLSAITDEPKRVELGESDILRESASMPQQQQQQQQQQIGFRKKGEFVNQTEEVLRSCLEAGLAPDISLRRSLLFVWCKDRQSRSTLLASEEMQKGTSSSDPLILQAKKSSIRKAEDLLARISVITAARSLGAEESKEKLKSMSIACEDAASMIVAWDTEESVDDLLPHPSVYMQLASAWKEEGYALDVGALEAPAVQRAEAFLLRVKDDIMKLSSIPYVTALDEDSRGDGATSLLHGDDSHAARNKVHRSAIKKSNCLYIAYNLLLAAHALTSTGTTQCKVAEVISADFAIISSFFILISNAFIYPEHSFSRHDSRYYVILLL